ETPHGAGGDNAPVLLVNAPEVRRVGHEPAPRERRARLVEEEWRGAAGPEIDVVRGRPDPGGPSEHHGRGLAGRTVRGLGTACGARADRDRELLGRGGGAEGIGGAAGQRWVADREGGARGDRAAEANGR